MSCDLGKRVRERREEGWKKRKRDSGFVSVEDADFLLIYAFTFHVDFGHWRKEARWRRWRSPWTGVPAGEPAEEPAAPPWRAQPEAWGVCVQAESQAESLTIYFLNMSTTLESALFFFFFLTDVTIVLPLFHQQSSQSSKWPPCLKLPFNRPLVVYFSTCELLRWVLRDPRIPKPKQSSRREQHGGQGVCYLVFFFGFEDTGCLCCYRYYRSRPPTKQFLII